MRRTVAILLCTLIAAGLAGTLSACGAEAESEAAEGEPVVVDELSYNVALTRYLNPDDNEDTEYLVGMPPPDPGQSYLGIFLTIQNDTDEAIASASDYAVSDTLDDQFDVLDSESPYALEIGADVPPDGELPLADTTAASGPNHGALLVFLVDDSVNQNRPLTLEIQGADEDGEVILDI